MKKWKAMGEFGDRIDWHAHVGEILDSGDQIFHTWDKDKFKESIGFIQTDTEVGARKALDCGCHMGRWIDVVHSSGLHYTGVDQCDRALSEAKKRRPDVDLVHSFLWDMKFNEEFDISFTHAVLQHNQREEQERIVPKIYDTLKYGGIFTMAEGTLPDDATSGYSTQRTQSGWIDMVCSFGFKFIKTFRKNPNGIEDNYIFRKERNG